MHDTPERSRPSDGQGHGADLLEEVWKRVREGLRASVPSSTFQLWLEPLRPLSARGGVLTLVGPEGVRTWAERRYAALIAEVAAEVDPSLVEVRFAAGAEESDCNTGPHEAGANPHHTFERFVIGEGNRLAHAASLAVAEAPSEAYNPLFLHGPPGLGKTHLLGAIANYLRANAPDLDVRFTTAEGFTNEFVASLKRSGADEFKQRYRALDVLLIDDVQFLEGKHHTEEEFFHTFNALHESGSQLVLSADRIPSELSALASRLRDRFEWGLTVAVERPNLAMRLAVLRRLALEANLEIAETGLGELARRIDLNVRQLHGALTRAVAHASLTAKPLDQGLMAEVAPRKPRGQGQETDRVLELVSTSFDIPPADLIGPGRSRPEVRARQVAMLLIRRTTDLSLPQIGRVFGGRDHSTVLNSIRRIESALETDQELSTKVTDLSANLHNPLK